MGSFIISCQCNETRLQGTIKKLLHKLGCKNNFGLNDKHQRVEGWAETRFWEGKPILHGAYKAFYNLQRILMAAWFRGCKKKTAHTGNDITGVCVVVFSPLACTSSTL